MLKSGTKKVRLMVELVVRAIKHVLQGLRWEVAFQQLGIFQNNEKVHPRILHKLSFASPPIVSSQRPTADLVRTTWPRNRPFKPEVVMPCIPLLSVPCRRLSSKRKLDD